MMWSRSSRKKESTTRRGTTRKRKNRKNEITIALCSCAINKKLSTPYDFTCASQCFVWCHKQRVKNPLKHMFFMCIGYVFEACIAQERSEVSNLRSLLVRYKWDHFFILIWLWTSPQKRSSFLEVEIVEWVARRKII